MEISKHPTLDSVRQELGSNPGHQFPSNIKVIGPDESIPDLVMIGDDNQGHDYSTLNKVNRAIKVAAVLNPHQLHYDEENNVVYTPEYELDEGYGKQIAEMKQDTLAAAVGSALTPENKHWLLLQMGFSPLSKGRWKNVFFDQEIGFDLHTDTLTQLMFRIFKAGYYNAHTEWSSQQKTGQA